MVLVAISVVFTILLSLFFVTTMDLSFILPYILLCLALASECHMEDVSVLLTSAALRPMVYVFLVAVSFCIYSRDLFLAAFLFVFSRYITLYAELPTAMCFAICALCALNCRIGSCCAHIFGAAICCAGDILSAYIRMAAASLVVLSNMSTLMVSALKTISFKKVYQGVAVVYLNLFIICAITLAIDAAITATTIITWTSTITSAMSWCNESPILGSLFGIYIYGSLSPGTCGHTYLETIC